jgi:DNA-directed RNA polymerase subunit H (RpoH/RPB5)
MPQPTSSGTITLIHKSRKTILDYLKNQGFNTADYEDFGVNEIHAMLSNDKLDMLMSSVNGGANERKVYVKYHLGRTLRNDNINDFVEDLFNIDRVLTKKDMLVIIIKQEINQTLTNILNQFWERDGIFIVLFSLDRLQFNILKHQYVPKHTILNDKETKEFIEFYKITDMKQLPDISRYDPVSQAIGMRPGQICKIERPSKTAVTTLFYRYCN